MSCGDAAGLVNPVTGEGISAAFTSGDLAAGAVADYLGRRGPVALTQFSRRIGSVFSAKYRDYFKQALKCVMQSAVLRPCTTGFDKKMQMKISTKLASKNKKLGNFVFKNGSDE